MQQRIYVDHAATTPVHPQVLAMMDDHMRDQYGNPSSVHAFGREAKASLNRARKAVADGLGCTPQEVVFTSGGTEADNLAIMGAVRARQDRGRHIITSRVEHHAVLHTCQYLEQNGYDVTYLPVDETGQVSVEDVRHAMREDTVLVTLMYANNEVGTLQPIAEIGALLKEQDIPLHTDAVQALGIETLNLAELPVSCAAFAAHKINGPKGVGCLYVSSSKDVEALQFGGAQERKHRPGTENTTGIVGFAEADGICMREHSERRKQYADYRQLMLETLNDEGVNYKLNGHPEAHVPHIVNMSFPSVKAEVMLANLDLEGIAASSGSACTAGSLQPSHVVTAMYGEERARTAIRFSFGRGNTKEQIRHVARTTAKIVKRLDKTPHKVKRSFEVDS
jgi:cysteine desulfurase